MAVLFKEFYYWHSLNDNRMISVYVDSNCSLILTWIKLMYFCPRWIKQCMINIDGMQITTKTAKTIQVLPGPKSDDLVSILSIQRIVWTNASRKDSPIANELPIINIVCRISNILDTFTPLISFESMFLNWFNLAKYSNLLKNYFYFVWGSRN